MIRIIGLEYICQLYNVQYKQVAESLGISKQSINSWISGARKIPEKHLVKLSEMFDVSQEYFQKELLEEEKIKIQTYKIKNDIDSGGVRKLYKDDPKNNIKTDEELKDVFKDDMLTLLDKTRKLQTQMIINDIEKQMNKVPLKDVTITNLIYTKIYELLTKRLDKKVLYTLLIAFGKQYDEDDMWIEKGYYDKDLLDKYMKLFDMK